MSYPTHDTNWSLSQKGNWWRRKSGVTLVVGERKDGRYWARRADNFMQGSYETIADAKHGAETNTPGDEIQWDEC